MSIRKGKYLADNKVIGVSKIFQNGKTQVPKEVRVILEAEDGDHLVWRILGGKIVVERLS